MKHIPVVPKTQAAIKALNDVSLNTNERTISDNFPYNKRE